MNCILISFSKCPLLVYRYTKIVAWTLAELIFFFLVLIVFLTVSYCIQGLYTSRDHVQAEILLLPPFQPERLYFFPLSNCSHSLHSIMSDRSRKSEHSCLVLDLGEKAVSL